MRAGFCILNYIILALGDTHQRQHIRLYWNKLGYSCHLQNRKSNKLKTIVVSWVFFTKERDIE